MTEALEAVRAAARAALASAGAGSQWVRAEGATALTNFVWSPAEMRVGMAIGTAVADDVTLSWQRMIVDHRDWYLPLEDGSPEAAQWWRTSGPGYAASPLSVLYFLAEATSAMVVHGSVSHELQVEVRVEPAEVVRRSPTEVREDVEATFHQLEVTDELNVIAWIRNDALVAASYSCGVDFRVDTEFDLTRGPADPVPLPGEVEGEFDLVEFFEGLEVFGPPSQDLG